MKRNRLRFSPSVQGLEERALLSTFTVLNTNDSGAGSLRAEVALANATPGSTINFDSSVTGTIVLTSGEIAITAPVTINGPGASVLSIDGGGTSRIFDISGAPSPPNPVAINDLAFQHGSASSSNFTPLGGGDGGAIQTDNSVVTLHGDVFVDNFATNRGGAIYNQAGMVTVDSCSFTRNSTDFHGGAIYNSGKEIVPSAASLGIINSVFIGNKAKEGGGAIENAEAVAPLFGIDTVKATVINSVFTENSAGQYGGAISDDNTGVIQVLGDTFTGNVSAGTGGAISSGSVGPLGSATVVQSKFVVNSAVDQGGGIFSDSPLTLTNSLVEFNSSALSGLAGGGVHAKNSTFVGTGNTIIFNTPNDLVLV